MNFIKKLFAGSNGNDPAEQIELMQTGQVLSEIPAPEEKTQHFDEFKLTCPWIAQRIDLTTCRDCRFFGGFIRQRMIQYRDEHGYRYRAFPMPAALAEGGKWKSLPQMRIVFVPVEIICNFPTRQPLTPEWRAGFDPDADGELQRMGAVLEEKK